MESQHEHGPFITVHVHAPSVVEPRDFRWRRGMRVGEAAREAASAFGITTENPTLQNAQHEVLDREQTLAAAGVRDGDTLELVDAGGGVFTVAAETSRAVVAAELPPVRGYAARHGWKVAWDPEALLLEFDASHPATPSDGVRVRADVAGYRAVPPAWTVHGLNGDTIEARFPAAGAPPGVSGSIFHSTRIICAPFNRLAFADHAALHANWGDAVKWLDIRGHVRALTLADMLAVITAHLRHSPGWMS